MPIRPFPFALRVGTDIISVNRIREAITRARKKDGNAQFSPFLNKILTLRERSIFFKTFPNFTIDDAALLPRVSMHLAGRWAAKEAVIKAAKPRKLVYLDVEVLRHGQTGEWYGVIRDNTFVYTKHAVKHLDLSKLDSGTSLSTTEAFAAETGTGDPILTHSRGVEETDDEASGQMVAISISHDGDYATAVCIAPLTPAPGDVGGEAEARMYNP